MRNFLERHSALYQWAGREKADAAQGWLSTAQVYAVQYGESVVNYETVIAQTQTRHNDAITQHDAANARLRRVNRDLVSALRARAVAASEFPAERCPRCGSLAAFPEYGKHQIGLTSSVAGTMKLYCDGSEE